MQDILQVLFKLPHKIQNMHSVFYLQVASYTHVNHHNTLVDRIFCLSIDMLKLEIGQLVSATLTGGMLFSLTGNCSQLIPKQYSGPEA